MVAGRKADDNANINLRFVGGARGQLWASMVACGIGQGLSIRVFGEQASLEWHQEHPNEHHLRFENQPNQVLYLWDEWAAYISGARAGVEQAEAGRFREYGQDMVDGPMDLLYFCTSSLQAIQLLDTHQEGNVGVVERVDHDG